MDFCACKRHPAKTCMLLNGDKSFVGCDLDSGILSAAEHGLYPTHALQVLSSNYDLTEDGEVRTAAPLIKKSLALILACKEATL